MKIIKLLIIIAILFGSYKLLSKEPTAPSSKNTELSEEALSDLKETEFVFYFGNTCPHCLVVEEFMEENQIDQKLNIVSKEIYDNTDNQEEMISVVNKYCPEYVDPASGGIGVPLFFDVQNENCLLGDESIINFMKEKIK